VLTILRHFPRNWPVLTNACTISGEFDAVAPEKISYFSSVQDSKQFSGKGFAYSGAIFRTSHTQSHTGCCLRCRVAASAQFPDEYPSLVQFEYEESKRRERPEPFVVERTRNTIIWARSQASLIPDVPVMATDDVFSLAVFALFIEKSESNVGIQSWPTTADQLFLWNLLTPGDFN